MNNITFDKIHSQTKQKKLQEMMALSAQQCHAIENNNKKLEHCPICRSKDVTFYVEKFGYLLDQCLNCKQIFCNPMPNHEQLNAYYNGPMKRFENDFFLASFENRIPIFTHRIDVIHQYLSSGTLLDVGSAIGIFIEALYRYKTPLEIHCCEPSIDACDRLKSKFPHMTLYNDWLQNIDNELEYDGITLWDTLEHIEDIELFTQTIHKLLKVGGYWFFSTPNTNSFEWKVAGKEHVQLLPPGHINLFNTKSIPLLLTQQGFELIEMQTPNGSLDVSYIEKLIFENDKYDNAIGKYLKNKFLDTEFKDGFSQLISNTNNAGNVFIVARKVIN